MANRSDKLNQHGQIAKYYVRTSSCVDNTLCKGLGGLWLMLPLRPGYRLFLPKNRSINCLKFGKAGCKQKLPKDRWNKNMPKVKAVLGWKMNLVIFFRWISYVSLLDYKYYPRTAYKYLLENLSGENSAIMGQLRDNKMILKLEISSS